MCHREPRAFDHYTFRMSKHKSVSPKTLTVLLSNTLTQTITLDNLPRILRYSFINLLYQAPAFLKLSLNLFPLLDLRPSIPESNECPRGFLAALNACWRFGVDVEGTLLKLWLDAPVLADFTWEFPGILDGCCCCCWRFGVEEANSF